MKKIVAIILMLVLAMTLASCANEIASITNFTKYADMTRETDKIEVRFDNSSGSYFNFTIEDRADIDEIMDIIFSASFSGRSKYKMPTGNTSITIVQGDNSYCMSVYSIKEGNYFYSFSTDALANKITELARAAGAYGQVTTDAPETETEASTENTEPNVQWHTECAYCGKTEGEGRWFIARVVDANGVVPIGSNCFEAAEAGDAEIRLSFGGENMILAQGFETGNVVRVTYSGYVMESYPVQIVPDTVELAQSSDTVMQGLHMTTYYLPYQSDAASITFGEDGKCSVNFLRDHEEPYRANYWIEGDKVYLDIQTSTEKVHVFTILENALVLDTVLTTANLWDTMAKGGPVVYFLPSVSENEMLGTTVMAAKGLGSIPMIETLYAKYKHSSTRGVYDVYAFMTREPADEKVWADKILGTEYTFTYSDSREILVYTQGRLLTLNEAYDQGYVDIKTLQKLNEHHHDCGIAHSYDEGVIVTDNGSEEILYTCHICRATQSVALPKEFSFALTYEFDLKYNSQTGELKNGYNYDQNTACKATLELDHIALMNIYRILYNGHTFEIKENFEATDQHMMPSYEIEMSYTIDGETTSFAVFGVTFTTYSEWNTGAAFCVAYEQVVKEYILESDAYKTMPPNQNMYE